MLKMFWGRLKLSKLRKFQLRKMRNLIQILLTGGGIVVEYDLVVI